LISLLRRLSFQAKLLVTFVAIVALTTLVGYQFINQSIKRAFSEFTVRSYTGQERAVIQLIRYYYDQTGDLNAVIASLERSPREAPLVLTDNERNVVYAPDARYLGRRLSPDQIKEGQPLVLTSGEEWTLIPARIVLGQDALEQAFLRTIRRSLWLAGLTAAVAGIFLVFLLLRQMTEPLRRLTTAARNIAAGKLDERVFLASSDEMGHLAQSFNEMAESLESAERTKKQMIADISHELRTPLTAVRLALEALRDGVIEINPETLAVLHDKILLTTRLVQDLHQLALADAGQLSIHRSPIQMETVVDSIVETVGVQLEDARIRLHQDISAELPSVDIDRQRIEQVLLNLLANAIRHTPQGGTISIEAVADGDAVRVSICDSGPGLSPEDLAHVFDRFYRADDARPSEGGAGLGLSIAKTLIEAHGGRIWAENAPAGGACFRFTLPTSDSPARNHAAVLDPGRRRLSTE